MSEKTLNTRIQEKHDTQTKWEDNPSFIPESGEVIIYDSDAAHTMPRVKIGDGITSVENLPFFYEPITQEDLDEICVIP